jgi:hypothetical protein
MLFLFGEAPKTEGDDKSTVATTKGAGPIEQLNLLTAKFDAYVASVGELPTTLGNINKQMTTMEDSANALQRSMGGVVFGADEFRETLRGAFKDNLDLNMTFKDSVDIVAGMSTEMSKMVYPTEKVLTNAMAFSKVAGLTTSETGKMIGEFSNFGGTQLEATTEMTRLGKVARLNGLDAKSFTQEVAKNLKQASLFGFKGGVKDIEEMVKKTKLLGTSMEKLQIKGAAEKLLDPETAMQTAASLQMIGGNIGALGNPFQLLHMGQKDMKKLTDEVLNMAKATFTFDKETGAFVQTTEDMYALRAQADALGVSYEETANAGKQLAKLELIKTSTDLSKLNEEQQNMVAQLSQIDKDGKVTIDIPGFDEQEKSLEELMKDDKFKTALDEYQDKANLPDKDLAISQLSVAEKQAASLNKIEYAIIASLSKEEEKEYLKQISEASKKEEDIMLKAAKDATPLTKNALTGANLGAEAAAQLAADTYKNVKYDQNPYEKKPNDGGMGGEQVDVIEGGGENNDGMGGSNTNNDGMGGSNTNNDGMGGSNIKGKDMFFPSGDAPMIMSKGQIYEGIKEDSVYAGTDFEKIFERGKAATNVLSEMMAKGGAGGSNTEVSGKVDFGEIKVKIDAPGVDTSMLDKALNSRQFTNQIMSMVANQKSFYTNQATLQG